MSFQSKTLNCWDCGISFTFTANEQEYYKSKGFNSDPKRCPACRRARKELSYGNKTNSYRFS
jgi:hypothetical protein